MKVRKRIRYGQNFFKDVNLVAELVDLVNISPKDTVCEIGPGEGIITKKLAKVVKKVIAVEIDKELYLKLKEKFNDNPNVSLINEDFLKYEILEDEYKVFSNIPFNITADVVRKLLSEDNPPIETYLVLQKEATDRFTGIPKKTQFSVLSKPWFNFEVIKKFNKSDFEPEPSVDTVFLKIEKRKNPSLSEDEKSEYIKFVKYGFSKWKANLGKNYKKVFSYKQWKRLSKDLKFKLNSQPTDLTFDQWLGLFKFYFQGMASGVVKKI